MQNDYIGEVMRPEDSAHRPHRIIAEVWDRLERKNRPTLDQTEALVRYIRELEDRWAEDQKSIRQAKIQEAELSNLRLTLKRIEDDEGVAETSIGPNRYRNAWKRIARHFFHSQRMYAESLLHIQTQLEDMSRNKDYWQQMAQYYQDLCQQCRDELARITLHRDLWQTEAWARQGDKNLYAIRLQEERHNVAELRAQNEQLEARNEQLEMLLSK